MGHTVGRASRSQGRQPLPHGYGSDQSRARQQAVGPLTFAAPLVARSAMGLATTVERQVALFWSTHSPPLDQAGLRAPSPPAGV